MSTAKRLRGVDRRSTWARRHKALAVTFAADLGGELSSADRSLADHAATVAVEAERMKARQLNGEALNLQDLVRVTNALIRTRKELSGRDTPDRDPFTVDLPEYPDNVE
jgi:hypothetical protein